LFEDLGFEIGPGELVEVWGPNGSGKTTLLRCIVGLYSLEAGTVELPRGAEGVPSMLYVGHKGGFNALLSPLENLRWYGGLLGRRYSGAEANRALSRVGLESVAHRACQRLSAGQQRRVALARLVLSDSRLWVMDEPLTALDEQGSQVLRDLVVAQRRAGGAVLCATHQRLGIPDTRVVELGRAAV